MSEQSVVTYVLKGRLDYIYFVRLLLQLFFEVAFFALSFSSQAQHFNIKLTPVLKLLPVCRSRQALMRYNSLLMSLL